MRIGILVFIFFIVCLSSTGQTETASHLLSTQLQPVAEFKITSLPVDVTINLLALNLEADDLSSNYSITHNSGEKIITAQVTGGSGNPEGIVLKAELEAPAAGTAASLGQVEILDGTAVIPGAQTVIQGVPPGHFANLALHYFATANITASVGGQLFTVTFTVSE